MKTNIWICSLLLAAADMLHGAQTDNGVKQVNVDGHYTMMPQLASQPALLAQDLGSLIIDPLKFYGLKVAGKIESIQLTLFGDALRVVAIDSAGESVLSESVPVVTSMNGKSGALILRREWKSQDEWGSSRGTTTAKFIREEDGNLLVTVSIVSSGRTLIFPRGKSRSDSWIKYPSVKRIHEMNP
jgi:hypothetical protein